MWYNNTLGHTENGGRFDFQLPCTFVRWEVIEWNIM
nr:MAG TPA: hypothetical protein [Caudoviricetes sp.]